MVPQSYYRCWVEVDLEALRQNVQAIRRRLTRGEKLLAVVKADAYGHGLAPIASTLMQCGVDGFAVANLAEALVVRQLGGNGWPILLLGAALPFEIDTIVEQQITPTISTLAEARLFSEAAARHHQTVGVQVEIDTGMGRVGFWHEEAAAQVQTLASLPHLRLEALYTHFPSADENPTETRRELASFLAVTNQLASAGVTIPCRHAANSAALLNLPEATLELVRPGLLLYGICPVGGDPRREFRPVLSFKARVAFVKGVPTGRTISYGQTYVSPGPMRIATVAAGYGDGFNRHLSNGAQVLIGGRRCPVLGRVTMDQLMVDVTEVPHVDCGDEVVFIGRQGDAVISAAEMAQWAGTIAWEVLCGITKAARVPRVYHGTAAA